jgi:hypothetical protein
MLSLLVATGMYLWRAEPSKVVGDRFEEEGWVAKTKVTAFRSTISFPADTTTRLKRVAAQFGSGSLLDVVRTAVLDYIDRHDIPSGAGSKTAQQLRTLISADVRFKNPLQDELAAWRVRQLVNQVSTMTGPFPYLQLAVSPPPYQTLQILTDLLESLGAGDDFLVVTDLRFWRFCSDASSDCADDYLRAQQNAIRRGMRLYRVILIDPALDQDDRNKQELARHEQFLRSVVADLETRGVPSDEIYGRIKVVKKRVATIDDGLRRLGHFACIRRLADSGSTLDDTESADLGCLVIEPEYYPSGDIKDLQFKISDGPGRADLEIKQLLDRFKLATVDAEPIAILALS